MFLLFIFIFNPNRTNPKSFWLAGLFSVILLCVFLSLVSVVMLLISPSDQDENAEAINRSEDMPCLGTKKEIEQFEARDADASKKLKWLFCCVYFHILVRSNYSIHFRRKMWNFPFVWKRYTRRRRHECGCIWNKAMCRIESMGARIASTDLRTYILFLTGVQVLTSAKSAAIDY